MILNHYINVYLVSMSIFIDKFDKKIYFKDDLKKKNKNFIILMIF